ncbi:MAG: hypothetical protein NT159_10670 [Proteobacteria bacterium]|nr:hypothetical protein [Pseudomonadota bacterium]
MISSGKNSVPPAVSGRRFGAATLALAFLAGCSSPPIQKPDETKVKQFTGQGYQTDDHFGIATTYANWISGYLDFDISLTVPAKPGLFPLVIYLPALGETRSAGETWRTVWAQSGFAVLSMQPLVDDARVWSSAKARNGDFALLARERYSPKVMATRLEALQSALTEMNRRHSHGEAPLDRIDLSRVAIAGYDMGAYTAMAIAGESIRGVPGPVLPFSIKAVIALSPYSDFSGAPFGERYAGIHGPVLSVTSDNDTDALGLVTSPSIRKAPFETMPGGNKYLLTMSGIPHSGMSGGGLKPEAGEAGGPPGKAERSQGGGDRTPDGGNRGGHRKGGTSGGGAGDGGRTGGERPGAFRDVVFSPTSLAISDAAIQGVTTAFLDAYVKEDQIAREWLDKDASRWLRDRGEIKRK